MASLANQTISSTYDGLVKTSTDQPVPISGVQLLEDGVGNSLALSVGRANQGVTITGTLTATSISGVLADGVTATTQSSGDNSTKVATTAYVDAQVAASDLDFAGDAGTGAVDLDSQSLTIAGTANEIETSASGQTITIGLPSSVTVGTLTATTLAGTLSTAAQTNITSVGTLSSLAVSGNLTVDTNTLFVDAASNSVGIGTSSPSSYGGGYSALTLNGSSDGGVIDFKIGDTRKSSIYNTSVGELFVFEAISATAGIALLTGSSERMRIDSSGNVGIGVSSPENILHLVSTAGSQSAIQIAQAARGTAVIGMQASASVPANFVIGTDVVGEMIFKQGVTVGDLSSGTERMRITSGGQVQVGTTLGLGGRIVVMNDATSGVTIFDGSANGNLMLFVNSNAVGIGTITTNGSSTSYNTTSDYRLKENVVPMKGALDRVSQLQPSRFNFIADPEKTVDGFLAHQVQEVVPEAIVGEKDAVDEEGNPVYQGIDQSKLVPLLVGAIQELKAEIETLKSQING